MITMETDIDVRRPSALRSSSPRSLPHAAGLRDDALGGKQFHYAVSVFKGPLSN